MSVSYSLSFWTILSKGMDRLASSKARLWEISMVLYRLLHTCSSDSSLELRSCLRLLWWSILFNSNSFILVNLSDFCDSFKREEHPRPSSPSSWLLQHICMESLLSCCFHYWVMIDLLSKLLRSESKSHWYMVLIFLWFRFTFFWFVLTSTSSLVLLFLIYIIQSLLMRFNMPFCKKYIIKSVSVYNVSFRIHYLLYNQFIHSFSWLLSLVLLLYLNFLYYRVAIYLSSFGYYFYFIHLILFFFWFLSSISYYISF